jgi:tape measure domain-containing protein
VADPIVIEVRMHDAASGQVRALRGELNQVAVSSERVAKASGSASTGLTRMEVATERARRAAAGLHQAGLKASAWLGGELVTMARRGALALGAVVTAVVGFGAKAASQFQTSQLAFETLLGSAEKGQSLFKELQAMNLKTPFELGDLTSSTQVLLRYGAAQGQVVPIMKSLSDIAATSDNPTENLGRLSLAIGQVISQGRLLGQDARQLAEAGFNPYAVLASKLGKTQEEVRKLGEAGKLSSKDLLDALISESNGLERFRGGAERMNQTLRGQLSNLKDQINVQLATSAQPLVASLTSSMPMIVALVGGLISQVAPPMFKLVSGLGDTLMALLPSVVPIVNALTGGLLMLLRAAGPAISALQPLGGQIGLALTQFFTALAPMMPDVVTLLGSLLLILPDFIRLLTDLLPALDTMVNLANGLLGFEPVRKILAGLLVVLLGYRVLSGVVGALTAFAGGLTQIAVAQEEVAATAAAGAAGPAGAAGGAGGMGKAGRYAAASGLGILALMNSPQAGKPYSVGQGATYAASAAGAGFTAFGPLGAVGGLGFAAGDIAGTKLLEWAGFGGDVDSNVARSSRVHALASSSTPGRSTVTSGVRNYALAGPGSGHPRGTAWDVAADYPQSYASNIRAMGGYATVHDTGAGRHVHAQIGDDAGFVPRSSSTPGDPGLPPILVTIERAYGQIDFEQAVARGVSTGLDRDRRRRIERGHIDRAN